MKRNVPLLWFAGAFAVMSMMVLAFSLVALLRLSNVPVHTGTSGGNADPLGASLVPQVSFSDVTPGTPLAVAVTSLAEAGIISGNADRTIRPNALINRAEAAKILTESVHATERAGFPFKDVSPSDWYAKHVDAAATAGIVRGYGDGTFGPHRLINRGEAAAMLLRAFKIPPPSVSAGAPWYAAPMTGLQRLGVIEGPSDPFAIVTRGEMILMVYRLLHPDEALPAHAAAAVSSSASSVPVLSLPAPHRGASSSASSALLRLSRSSSSGGRRSLPGK